MEQTPDLTHFFAIHRKLRIDTRRYARAIDLASPDDRGQRLRALHRWVRGFVCELDEHHHVEDAFFFPDLRTRVPSAGPVLDDLDGDHRVLDGILERWPSVAAALDDRSVPFRTAQDEARALATDLRDLLQRHLDVEDGEVLPLYWRHCSAEDYARLHEQAVKGGKKKGIGFIAPWNVYCLDPADRQTLIDEAPLPLKAVWWGTRGRFRRLEAAAFDGIDVRLDDIEPIPSPLSSR